MQKPPEHAATEHLPLAVRWARLRACYRMLNLASHHVLGFTVKLTLLVYFGFGLLFLFLRYAILPNIDYYKGYIEQAASRASGSQVSIARIYASWRGLRPNLFLADVAMRDGAGRQVLVLPSVSATLSWWSVLGKPRFESLDISRPDLDVRRGADGKLWVAGHYIDPLKGGDGQGADWLLAQREVVIREGRLHWTDDLRGAPELLLENVNFVMRNQWQRHRFALRATPPAALAGPLDLRADFSHPAFSPHPGDIKMWKGELYADLTGADLAAWKPWLDYPFELQSARGAVRAWLTLDHARLAGFTADVGLREVTARLAPQLPLLDLVLASGRVSASEVIAPGPADGTPTLGARGHTLALDDFALATRDGLVLPPTTLSERYVAAGGGQPASTAIQTRLLDLRTLSEVALRLPLGAAPRQLLAELDPRGRLLDFSAEWRGALPAAQSYHIKGRVEGLGMTARAALAAQPAAAGKPAQAAVAALPGFDQLSGSVDATEQGGSVRLAAPGLVLRMPAWFTVPDMTFDQLALQARWAFPAPRQLRIDLDSMAFQQQGLTATLHGSHLLALDGKGPGTIDLDGTANNFDVKTIGNYLPLHTPDHLRAWLTGALEDGLAQDVTLRLRGDLAQFPFGRNNNDDKNRGDSRGEFRVAGKLEHARLNYAPGQHLNDTQAPLWPQAENIHGSFLFDRTRMEIHGDTATTGGVALNGIKAVIPDLATHDLQLEIDGGASGSMTDYLKYVASSPVLGWIAHFTDQTTASGNAKLALKLHLPLAHLVDAKVEGALQLQGNDIVLFDGLPVISGSTGKIEFSETGVNLNALAGTFVGGPVAISGGSQPDNSIQVKLAGTVTAEGLRKTYPTPTMQRLAGRLSGGTRYTGLITERNRQLQVLVEAPLTGVGLDFPAPLAKAAADSMPLRFLLSASPANEAGVAHDDIKVSMGSLASHYQRQKQGKGNWTLVRGGIGVNQPAPEPDSGLMLNVSMKALDVDAWLAIGGLGAPAAPGAGVVAADGDIDLSEYVVPDSMAAEAAELTLGERKLQKVVVGATHQKGVWQANIDAAQISGYLTWNDTPSGQGRVTARLSSLIIPASEAAEVQSLLEGNHTAQSIPSLDIVAERFELFNTKLGSMELQAVNVAGGPGREWRVDKLALENPDGALNGSGKWVTQDGRSDTSLKFALDIKDAGKLLDRFGFVDTIAKGKGTLNGNLAWKGLPYSLDIPSLSGNIRMDVESGQFLKQDPGAAKLLGVLSLQALPRLLKLDFHDVFSEGLAFDGISATANIMHGVVQTNDLKMHGVAATVLMDGSADIANESTNLHVVVIPEFNLGTGPLVYGLAVNPVIGIGGFLAQLFLRAPVMKALTYQMQITGPWKAPVVTKLDNAKLEASDETAASAGKAAAAKTN